MASPWLYKIQNLYSNFQYKLKKLHSYSAAVIHKGYHKTLNLTLQYSLYFSFSKIQTCSFNIWLYINLYSPRGWLLYLRHVEKHQKKLILCVYAIRTLTVLRHAAKPTFHLPQNAIISLFYPFLFKCYSYFTQNKCWNLNAHAVQWSSEVRLQGYTQSICCFRHKHSYESASVQLGRQIGWSQGN